MQSFSAKFIVLIASDARFQPLNEPIFGGLRQRLQGVVLRHRAGRDYNHVTDHVL